MKIRYLLFPIITAAALLFPAVGTAQTADNPFLEKDGLAVVEIESVPTNGWSKESSVGGYTGDSYYVWQGADYFGQGGVAPLTYHVRITNGGTYNLKVRNHHSHHDNTEENDIWVSINGNGWTKLYSSTAYQWTWHSRLEIGHSHSDPRYDLGPGDHRIQISARSRGFRIDRFHLYLDSYNNPLDTSHPQSETAAAATPTPTPTPTGTPTPTPTPTPAPNVYEFDFSNGAMGWQFNAPANFNPSSGIHIADSLLITTATNDNVFGFWDSPIAHVPGSGPSGSNPPIYEADYEVYSSVDQVINPTVRFRVSLPEWTETYAYEITSAGDGAFTPSKSGSNYRHFFSPSGPNNAFRTSFDILNFNPGDAAGAVLGLRSVTLTNHNDTAFSAPNLVARYDFTQSNYGFSPRSAPPLISPQFSRNQYGLSIKGAQTNSGVQFGFWGIESGIALRPDSLYEIRFDVTSDAYASQVGALPAFRVRVNDSSFQSAVYTVVESVEGRTVKLPHGFVTKTYRLWYYPEGRIMNETMNLSFDYLYVPDIGNSTALTLSLSDIEIYEYK